MSDYSSSINSVSSSTNTPGAANANSVSALSGDEFMLLLLTELRNQNPLDPVDNKDLMNQITGLNSLEQLQSINTELQGMNNKSNQLTEAAGLIGKTVEVSADSGGTQSGVVTGVSLANDEIMLWLGDTSVALSDLVNVGANS